MKKFKIIYYYWHFALLEEGLVKDGFASAEEANEYACDNCQNMTIYIEPYTENVLQTAHLQFVSQSAN